MLKELKFTFKHTFWYSIGNLSTKLIGFILLPFYTTYLTTSEYGMLAILETTINILSPILFFNIANGLIRFFNDEAYTEKRGEILFNTLIFTLFTGIVANIIFQPFTTKLSQLFFNSRKFTVYFQLVFINIALQNLTYVIRSYYNAIHNSIKFSFINILRFLIVLVLTIYFLVKLELGITGILLAQTISFILIILLFIYSYLQKLSNRLNIYLLKQMLIYSAPLAFSSLSFMILSFGDRYVIKFLINDAAVGIYSLASKLANMIDFILLINFQLAYNPFVFSNYTKSNFKYIHKKLTTYLVFLTIIFSLLIGLFSKEIIYIFSPFNKDFWLAAKYIFLLVLIRPINSLRYMFSISFHISKKTKLIPVLVLFTAIINIVLDFIFISYYEIYGAVAASIISSVLMLVLYYHFSQKLYKLSYEYKRLAIILLAGTLLIIIGSVINVTFWLSIIIKVFIILLFLLLLKAFKFFDVEEIDAIRAFLKNWKEAKSVFLK